MSEPNFVTAAHLADVPQGDVLVIDIAGRSILLCHTEDGVFAVENLCSHAAQSLECGRVKNGWISCPTHGARFDLETGEPLGRPATQPIATFPVRIAGGIIEIAV